jgi:hypothetical protein
MTLVAPRIDEEDSDESVTVDCRHDVCLLNGEPWPEADAFRELARRINNELYLTNG